MTSFYKPELTQQKAKLFARCFTHCLTCSDIELNEDEQRQLLHFCNLVGEKDFVDSALARLERLNKEQTVEVLQKTIQQPS